MKYLSLIILIFLLLVFNSCSKDEKKIQNIQETTQELEFTKIYNEAYDELQKNNPYISAKKFLEAELIYPQSTWAPKSVLMASYSYYIQNYYVEAISNLERYLKTYPNDSNQAYAQYLLAMCYFEMIEDEKRDSEPIVKAMEKFQYILKNYPNTDFALDASFKRNVFRKTLPEKK